MEEKLLKYNEIVAEIKRLEYEIVKLQNEEVEPSSPMLDATGARKKGYIQSSVEKKAINNADKMALIKREKNEYEAEKAYIEAKLNLLKPIEKQAIELKYFKNLSDEAIARTIGREALSTVYRIVEKGLKKMK